MLDHEYEALKVHASIAPQSVDWPKPNFAEASIKGDKPKLGNADGPIHWHHLHDCVSNLRARTLKALGTFSGIDENKSLSLDGKREEKHKAAQAALDDLKKSQALIKARAAVEQQVAKWNKDFAPPAIESAHAAEIRAHVSRLKDGDRLQFVTKHITECTAAVLHGPAFLSGLTATEIDIVRRQFEVKVNPEASEAKAQTLVALAHCEQGWRNASNTIRSRGGLPKTSGNGQ